MAKDAGFLEQNQNSRAQAKSPQGGIFLMKKPLSGRAIGYSCSGSAVARAVRIPTLFPDFCVSQARVRNPAPIERAACSQAFLPHGDHSGGAQQGAKTQGPAENGGIYRAHRRPPPPICHTSISENKGIMGRLYTRGYGTAKQQDFRSVPDLPLEPKTGLFTR